MLPLMAGLTQADELPLSRVRIKDRQCEVRPILEVLNVMHDNSRSIPPPLLAVLTFIPVKL